MLHLILNLFFGVWAWYFDFHKVYVILFEKKLNSRNNWYIYGICSIIDMFMFLDCIRFGFELFSQKMFELK